MVFVHQPRDPDTSAATRSLRTSTSRGYRKWQRQSRVRVSGQQLLFAGYDVYKGRLFIVDFSLRSLAILNYRRVYDWDP